MKKEIGELHFAIIGLALTHPFTFTGILLKKGVTHLHVWDADSIKRASFCKTYPQAIVHDTFDDVLAYPLDGAIICTESYLHPTYAIPFIEKGVPVCIDKVMVIDSKGLDQLLKAFNSNQTPIFSSSILRFSPDFQRVSQALKTTPAIEILGAEAKVFHSIAGFLQAGNTWQDEKDKGGGTLLNMGVHGIELLYSCIGSGVVKVWATTEKRFYKEAQSEDMATISIKYADGKRAAVQIVCGTNYHDYQMDVFTHKEQFSSRVPNENGNALLVQYGYDGMMDAFLHMVVTREAPVPIEETIEIIRVLLAARESARTGQWVDIYE